MPALHIASTIALTGIGATAVLDAWLFTQQRMGMGPSNLHLIGRWVGHMAAGRFTHAAIARSPRIPAELGLGLLAHYLTGIGYAAVLVALLGPDWTRHPTPGPALAFGLATVAAPFLVMQPAMGSGFAASKTPAPMRSRVRSIANHGVFGAGLYFAAAALAHLVP